MRPFYWLNFGSQLSVFTVLSVAGIAIPNDRWTPAAVGALLLAAFAAALGFALLLRRGRALDRVAPVVADSGEGRWMAQESVERGIPTPVIIAALMQRFASQGRADFSAKLLALMRNPAYPKWLALSRELPQVRAEIESGLFLGPIETLEPGHDDEEAVGGDEADGSKHGQAI